MRNVVILLATLIFSGCSTVTYTSQKDAEVVSGCIANGWRKAPSSGVELPVSLTKAEDYYFVDVVLVRDFPTNIPFHSIWAKVRQGTSGNPSGSTTEYRRNFQIIHANIDRVVKECQ